VEKNLATVQVDDIRAAEPKASRRQNQNRWISHADARTCSAKVLSALVHWWSDLILEWGKGPTFVSAPLGHVCQSEVHGSFVD
jgi:hypothetical protein